MKKLLLMLSMIALLTCCKKEEPAQLNAQSQNPPPPPITNVVDITPGIEHFFVGVWESCDPGFSNSYRLYAFSGSAAFVYDSLLHEPYTTTSTNYRYKLIKADVNKIKCWKNFDTVWINFEIKPDSSLFLDGFRYCRQ